MRCSCSVQARSKHEPPSDDGENQEKPSPGLCYPICGSLRPMQGQSQHPEARELHVVLPSLTPPSASCTRIATDTSPSSSATPENYLGNTTRRQGSAIHPAAAQAVTVQPRCPSCWQTCPCACRGFRQGHVFIFGT